MITLSGNIIAAFISIGVLIVGYIVSLFWRYSRKKIVTIRTVDDLPAAVDGKVHLDDPNTTYVISGNIDLGPNQLVLSGGELRQGPK